MTTQTVAVTGADGFIGSHLVETLVAAGYNVRAMVQYNSVGSWGWLETVDRDVLESVEVISGDVRDRDSVAALMAGAEMVCHLAALIAIPYSYQAPWSYLETNASGTLNVLEAARAYGTSRVVATSTSEVYGTAQYVPMDESHPLHAQSPYSASKIAADKLVESYHLSFGLPVVTLRPFNTYGPRQSARAVIPTVISQLAAGRREISLGSLTPTRDFTFVRDTAGAFLSVLEAPAEQVVGQTFNAGSSNEISVGDLATLISDLMGVSIEIRCEEERRRPESSRLTVCTRIPHQFHAPRLGSRITLSSRVSTRPLSGSRSPRIWRITRSISTTYEFSTKRRRHDIARYIHWRRSGA